MELGQSWRRTCTDFCKRTRACHSRPGAEAQRMIRFTMMLSVASMLFAFSNSTGQQMGPASSVAPSTAPSPEPSPPAIDQEIVPTFETQKLARTYILDIPAPRGQITDRNGAPLAEREYRECRYARVFESQMLEQFLHIPAPRGQITDRNGAPLAQNQLSY